VRRRHLLGRLGAAAATPLAGCAAGDESTVSTAAGRTHRDRRDAAAAADSTTARRSRYRNPVYEAHVFPDPTAIRAPDGPYYAYATYHEWDGDADRPLVPAIRSRNLVDWEYVGPAFAARPNWKRGGVWAPAVVRRAGRYLLYYSLARWGDPNPGIGVAVADDPTGPFADRGPVLWSEGVGVPNSIDPCPFVDGETPYLFWGSKRGVYGARLAPDGLSIADDADPFRVAGEGVEAAHLVARGGRYYLFVSAGTCCEGAESTYRVLAGRSASLRGPYRGPDGERLTASTGAAVVRGGDAFVGPGHCTTVLDDAGERWLLYHAYDREDPWRGETPRRVLALDPLEWRDGWPRVPSRTPSAIRRAPRVSGR
jgi:arabinan endo-1,5-alpha-L-arabinosidase